MDHGNRHRCRLLRVLFCFSVFAVAGTLGPAHVGAASSSVAGRQWVAGEVVLQFREGSSGRAEVLQALGVTRVRVLGRSGIAVSRSTRLGVEEAIAQLRDHPAIRFIEPNYVVSTQAVPIDPLFERLWGLDNRAQTGGVAGADIGALEAWDVTTGSRDVVVAILDTGVAYRHPDLARNVWSNSGEVAGNGLDDDGNGFVDDVIGWDFRNDDGDPDDDHGHGTHVAGTVGAVGSNRRGVTGVSWQVRLLPVKFLHADGFGSIADAIAGIDYAIGAGAHVLNCSWGGGFYSEGLRLALERAHDAGVLVAAAAGNQVLDVESLPFYPASYDLPNIVAVAATDHRDRLAGFSNWGAVSIDLAAPGDDILSTHSVPPGYAILRGTSMATPHVAGTAALILALYPGAAPVAVRAAILDNVDLLPALHGVVSSGGRLNAHRPLLGHDATPPRAIADLRAVAASSRRVDLAWSAPADDAEAEPVARYEVRHAAQPFGVADFETAALIADAPIPGAPGREEHMPVDGLAPRTTYWFAARAFDEWGNVSPVTDVISVTTMGPPAIAASPTAVSVDVFTGESATRALRIENEGAGELSYRVRARSDLPEAVDVLLLQRGADLAALRASLAGFPELADVDVVDGGVQTVSAPLLDGYDAVILSAIDPFPDPATLGDLLADYVDRGGGVVLTLNTPSAGWELRGRFRDAGYSPVLESVATDTPSIMGEHDPWHPVLAGVTALRGEFLAVLSPRPEAEVVARWRFGAPIVALAGGNSNVAAVNVHLDGGEFWSGDVPRLLANTARWVAGGVGWLRALPARGTVPGGAARDVGIVFDGAGLLGGDYAAELIVESDAPRSPAVHVAARMGVAGAADVALDRASLDFGTIFEGDSAVRAFTILNVGTDFLSVHDFATDGPDFHTGVMPFELPPGVSREVEVTFRPASAGALEDSLTFDTNDPDEPRLAVSLAGTAVGPPVIDTQPASLRVVMSRHSVVTRTLVVHNRGSYPLTFQTRAERVSGPWDPSSFSEGFESDLAGWLDEGGPNLKEIVTGVAAEGESCLHQVTRVIGHSDALRRSLGRVEPHYMSFRIRSGSTATDDGFFALKDDRARAAVWFYAKANGRFFLNGIGSVDTSVAYTSDSWWHVELKNIDFERRSLDYWVNGRSVAVDVPFLQPADSFAVIDLHNFSAGSEAWWDDIRMYRSIGIVPGDGRLPPGESAELTLYFDTTRLFARDYAGRIVIDSNDPAVPRVDVPIDLIVGGPILTVSATVIDLGGVTVGATGTRRVTVTNAGERELAIDWIASDRPEFSAAVRFFALAGGESFELDLLFTPGTVGPVEATLWFSSNDPREQVPSIRLRGAGQTDERRGGP